MSCTVFPRIYTNLQSSPTARNFNNSRPIYVILWEMRNHYRNIWFMKNSKCQHFLFLKNSPRNSESFQHFTLYSKGCHFSITKLDILIFYNILHLEIYFWNLSSKRQHFPHLTKFKKQNALPCKFQKKKNSKGCCFIVEKSQIIYFGEAVKLYQYFQNLFWNLEVFS